MRVILAVLLACSFFAGCGKAVEAGPSLPEIDAASGEAFIAEGLTLYNSYFGIEATLPADTRLYELENLGLLESDFSAPDAMSSTNYGEGATVYSLLDMALDRGGEPNVCRVILAVEQVEGAQTLDDFAMLLSRRIPALSVDADYQIDFEGREEVVMGSGAYYRLTFTESQPGHDLYKYEVYTRELRSGYYFTAVLFYNAEEGAAPGVAVGQSYIDTEIVIS